MILVAAAIALVAAAAFVLLGRAVASRPPGALWPLDGATQSFFAGHATHVALVFTASCWLPVLLALAGAAIVLALLRPAWRARAAFGIITTLAGWRISDALKDVFGRTRPTHWYLHHETSASYPSGHAMFAVLVYGLWGWFFATSALPRSVRIALAAACWCWAAGVTWSRLALGAHWATDLLGGELLAVTLLALAAVIVRASTFARRAEDRRAA